MITLKKIDVYVQFFLIASSLLLSVALRNEVVLYCYFIVGGWQVFSCWFQWMNNKHQPEVWDRKAYQWFLVISAATIPVGSPLVLLFVAPFTAVWYLFISFRELRIWQHRQFIQLR